MTLAKDLNSGTPGGPHGEEVSSQSDPGPPVLHASEGKRSKGRTQAAGMHTKKAGKDHRGNIQDPEHSAQHGDQLDKEHREERPEQEIRHKEQGGSVQAHQAPAQGARAGSGSGSRSDRTRSGCLDDTAGQDAHQEKVQRRVPRPLRLGSGEPEGSTSRAGGKAGPPCSESWRPEARAISSSATRATPRT